MEQKQAAAVARRLQKDLPASMQVRVVASEDGTYLVRLIPGPHQVAQFTSAEQARAWADGWHAHTRVITSESEPLSDEHAKHNPEA